MSSQEPAPPGDRIPLTPPPPSPTQGRGGRRRWLPSPRRGGGGGGTGPRARGGVGPGLFLLLGDPVKEDRRPPRDFEVGVVRRDTERLEGRPAGGRQLLHRPFAVPETRGTQFLDPLGDPRGLP